MADKHVRAKCAATGHVAALPERALQLGHIPGWEQVDGPVPEGPKASAFPKPADEASEDHADGESANQEEE